MSTVALSSWLAALSCSTSASHASSLAARASVPWNLAANWASTYGVSCGAGCAGGPAAPPVARSTPAALLPGPPAAAARLPTRGQRHARARLSASPPAPHSRFVRPHAGAAPALCDQVLGWPAARHAVVAARAPPGVDPSCRPGAASRCALPHCTAARFSGRLPSPALPSPAASASPVEARCLRGRTWVQGGPAALPSTIPSAAAVAARLCTGPVSAAPPPCWDRAAAPPCGAPAPHAHAHASTRAC